jgi:oxygen-independent coproporphyrinogen III oxidase
MAGIYLHVPFCRQACHYCDFHFSTNTDSSGRMVDALVREAELRAQTEAAWRTLPFRTLYLGGGTPSLLSPEEIGRLVSGVCSALGVEARGMKEVTLEANPEDLGPQKLDAWRRAGITRLSIGIQSFNDETLAWMNRAHSGLQAKEGVLRAHAAGFEALTVDLIYGVPTERNWEDDVATVLDLPVQHLSAYSLTVEPRTVLGTRVQRGEQEPLSDDRAVAEYRHLCDAMRMRGWHHYETSNWAGPKGDTEHWTAAHNSAYWSGEPYLGLGPGAHGFLGSRRYANVSNNPAYLRALAADVLHESSEELSAADRHNEALMTGLRTARGICLSTLESDTGLRPDVLEARAWNDALKRGDLVRLDTGRYRIPEANWITGDRVAAALFYVP